MKKYLLPALLAALLSACGGGGGDGDSGPKLDAFTTLINNEYLALSDTASPAEIDQLAVTSPEDTEPQML